MNDREAKADAYSARVDALSIEARCGCDRRKADSEGYAYVSTVGWICRREQCRRTVDVDKDEA